MDRYESAAVRDQHADMTRIAHLSDLHLLEESWRSRSGLERCRLAFLSTGTTLDADDRRARALSALRRARRLCVDHVLVTGDLTEDGTPAQFETLAHVLHESGLAPEQVTLVPGNHDAYSQLGAWRTALAGPLAAFQETSREGALTVVGEAVIQPLSTIVEAQHFTRAAGIVRGEAIEAIERTARDGVARGKAHIVAQHHSPLGASNPVWNWFDGTLEARPLRELLQARPEVHVVHGHVHHDTTLELEQRSHAQIFSVESTRDSETPLRVYRVEGGHLFDSITSHSPRAETREVMLMESAPLRARDC